MAEIKCTIEPCHYWGQGDRCTAEAIEVSENKGKPGLDAGVLGGGQAKISTSRETKCVTFIPKK